MEVHDGVTLGEESLGDNSVGGRSMVFAAAGATEGIERDIGVNTVPGVTPRGKLESGVDEGPEKLTPGWRRSSSGARE